MTARVLSWDWREQPDLDHLATTIHDLSAGRVRLHQVDTGSDEYAIVLTDEPITQAEADLIYQQETQ